ncbi:MAG TPA: phosphatase, partial [Asanoa sp.]
MGDATEAVRWLQSAASSTGPDDLATLVLRTARAVGATEIAVYLADYDQSALVPLPAPGLDREILPIETTLAGRAFASLEAQRAPDNPDRLWVPLLDGCEHLGVLELVGTPERTEAVGSELAACVALLVKTRRAYGDAMERLRGRRPMQVAAEIVWGLLPPLSFAAEDVMVTAVLEPCYKVGGDVFDYALNGDVLSLGLFDTCGHGIKASTLASLTVGAYRNARRRGLDLVDTAGE